MAGKAKSTIEIERNIIEKFFMNFKDFFKRTNRPVVPIFSGIILAIVAAIAIYLYIDHKLTVSYEKFEVIFDSYRANPEDTQVKENAVSDLKKLIESTSFGRARTLSLYLLGNILFDDGKYDEAASYLSQYVNKTSKSDIFLSLGVLKLSASKEETGKIDEAIDILEKYESTAKDYVAMDQVIYNIGRLYLIKNDKVKAKEYFSKVISLYSGSQFAIRARERLFLLNANLQ
ncbi:MAG TPA: tetratricopeptide repeat protein [Spirochaetota bacterium]|nr:tetratricopeptide repeat protein [Spirochaetota bacterium]